MFMDNITIVLALLVCSCRDSLLEPKSEPRRIATATLRQLLAVVLIVAGVKLIITT